MKNALTFAILVPLVIAACAQNQAQQPATSAPAAINAPASPVNQTCTPAACIARGQKMGYSYNAATIWCSRNNNGC